MLNVAQLGIIGYLRVVDDRLHVIFQLLHNILVLERCNIHVFTLDVGVEERALLRRVAVFEAFVPAQALELKIEVKDEKWVSEVDVSVAAIVACFEIHWKVKVVKSIRVSLLYHMKQVLLAESHRNILYHHSCQSLNTIQNPMKIDRIVGYLILSLVLSRHMEALMLKRRVVEGIQGISLHAEGVLVMVHRRLHLHTGHICRHWVER